MARALCNSSGQETSLTAGEAPAICAMYASFRTRHSGFVRAVTAIVLEAGGSEDEASAALLHDAVEDQGGAIALRFIRERFGDEVAAIVRGCTDAEEAGARHKPAHR